MFALTCFYVSYQFILDLTLINYYQVLLGDIILSFTPGREYESNYKLQ